MFEIVFSFLTQSIFGPCISRFHYYIRRVDILNYTATS